MNKAISPNHVATPRTSNALQSKSIHERIIQFFKLIRRTVYQFLVHTLDFFYDFFRYLKYSNSLYKSTRDRQKLEALLFFYYHKIEKALALPEVKPVFGLGYIEQLMDLVEAWVIQTEDTDAIVFRGAYAALVQYQRQTGVALSTQKPQIANRLHHLLENYRLSANENQTVGGTFLLAQTDIQQVVQNINFNRFVNLRRSVRNFSDKHIPDDEIIRAVKLAQQSPSVCNRQCGRLHIFSSAHDKETILKLQNGNKGFGHLADRILLVTADMRVFLSSGERNQPYIDAGMFAMNLIYALLARSIVSCCLNLSISARQDQLLHKTCQIPAWETPIMMIAIGYMPDHAQIAVSARAETSTILSFRDLTKIPKKVVTQ